MLSETEESVFYTAEIETQALGSVVQSPDSVYTQLVVCSHKIAFMHAPPTHDVIIKRLGL